MPRHIARCGRESDDRGGGGVAKGGACNDDDEDDPPAFSPEGAHAVGEEAMCACKDASSCALRRARRFVVRFVVRWEEWESEYRTRIIIEVS
jgi:hypothetical protein